MAHKLITIQIQSDKALSWFCVLSYKLNETNGTETMERTMSAMCL